MAAKQDTAGNRRGFLTLLFRWISGLTLASLIYPLLRFLGFTVKPKPRYVKVAAPLPASGFHQEREFILFAGPDNVPVAVSRTCTHLGCRVNFLEDKQLIECPCHQSRFTAQGVLVNGPAKKDLPTFAVETQTSETGKITGYVVTLS
jgi:cytochrome b6-f complex iron-sulfur subunit